MRCAWVISQTFTKDTDQRYQRLNELAPTWGSWHTWQAFNTDNSICTKLVDADKLISRAFQSVTNLYLPTSFYAELESPRGVKLFDGAAPSSIKNTDDVAAISIVGQLYDIVLLLGFKFGEDPDSDQIYTTISGLDRCQFVLVDSMQDLPERFLALTNFTCDEFKNVLELLT